MFLTLLVVFNFRDHALYLLLLCYTTLTFIYYKTIQKLHGKLSQTDLIKSRQLKKKTSNCRKLSPATHVITSLSPQAIEPIS